ncbi:hypothetical protein LCGC14_0095950 [marine sediment metagenome]|uniref:Uncharacterized protein n=1 Tax=marine sediment metagenome TaxID=412755 RepID=A0A0F9XW99_9ZZZZ|nr:hypothetical protein [Phycisphaerae bacterium]HDZ43609.1 hypothetical protein [Phycisphaerae bacterium]
MNDQPNNPPDGLEKLLRQWGARRAVEQAPLPAAPRPQQRVVLTLTARWAPLAAAAVLLIVAGVLYRASLIEYGTESMQMADRNAPEKLLPARDAIPRSGKRRLAIEPAPPAAPQPDAPQRGASAEGPADADEVSPPVTHELADTRSKARWEAGQTDAPASPQPDAPRRKAFAEGPADAEEVVGQVGHEAGQSRRRPEVEAGPKDAPDPMMDEGRDDGDRRLEHEKAYADERKVLEAERDKLAFEVTELRRQLAQADSRTDELRKGLNEATAAMSKLEQAQEIDSVNGPDELAPPDTPELAEKFDRLDAAEVAPPEALALADGEIPEREVKEIGADKAEAVGVDVAPELVTLYLTTVAPNETGMTAVQAVARNRLLIRRCGELRRRVGETETGRVIERLEVVLTRLALLDVADASEVEAFAAATRTGSLREMLAIARQQAEDERSRLVLLEIQLILLGVDRVS